MWWPHLERGSSARRLWCGSLQDIGELLNTVFPEVGGESCRSGKWHQKWPRRSWVAVQPFAEGEQLAIPATISSFLSTGAETMPVPPGAGMRRPSTEPQWPVSLHGTAWGLLILFRQQPCHRGMLESLGQGDGPWRAVAISL